MTRPPRARNPLPTSAEIDKIEIELNHAGDRAKINAISTEIGEKLRQLDLPEEYWSFIEIGRGAKKNFAQKLSTCLAQKFANALRSKFPGILPDENGRGQESRSGAAGGLKRLDVNYSNPQIGLGLGLSIKTVNFRDETSGRYTKNIRRLDGELRAEAQDYHVRQPFSVLIALIFLPDEAANDSETKSSLRHAWEVFERRAGRRATGDDPSTFERIWLCVYSTSTADFGLCKCIDTANEPPYFGLPEDTVALSDIIPEIEREYSVRNRKR